MRSYVFTGVVKFTIAEARNLKPPGTIKQISPYATAGIDSVNFARTTIMKNTMTPVWNQVALDLLIAQTF